MMDPAYQDFVDQIYAADQLHQRGKMLTPCQLRALAHAVVEMARLQRQPWSITTDGGVARDLAEKAGQRR